MLKAPPFTPQDLQPVLAALGHAGAVLVGGQCINLWSLLLERPAEEPWKSSRPYTSYDADAVATRTELATLVQELERRRYRVRVQLPRTPEESGTNIALVLARRGRGEIAINLLTGLLGIGGAEVRRNQVEIRWQNEPLALLHPELCVESKTLNLLMLAQDVQEEPRQDRKHLLLALANLRERLRAASVPANDLDIAGRLVEFAIDDPGRAVRRRHGIDVLSGVPWADWRSSDHSALREFAKREAELREEILRRDEAEKEVERWLAKLQSKSPRRPKR